MNETKRFNPSRLRQARGKRSVEQLAVVAGVSSMTIRNWEAGRGEPDASKLSAIAALLEKQLDFFFTRGAA